jgi:hypothetical protein
VLLIVAGAPLVALPDRSADWFAWTVASPLTATLAGGLLWSVAAMAVAAVVSSRWVDARGAVLSVLAVGPFCVVVAFLGADDLHDDWLQWAWVGIHAVLPVLAGAALLTGRTGESVQREESPSPALSALVALGAGALLAIAGVLLLDPSRGARMWPWPVTVIDARTIGAVVFAIAVASAVAIVEGEPRRLRALGVLDVAVGVAVVHSLARDNDLLDWGRPMTFLVLLFAALLAGAGVWSIIAGLDRSTPEDATPKRARNRGSRERHMKRSATGKLKGGLLKGIKGGMKP